MTTSATEFRNFKKRGLAFLEAAPVTWEAKVDALPMSERQELERFLSGVCERAARLIGYLEYRGTIGCGDHGHAAAVDGSNKLAAKVRKALGYTIAKHDIRF